MSTCKDCLHYEVCSPYTAPNETYPEVGGCKVFKPKADYVEVKYGEWGKQQRIDEFAGVVGQAIDHNSFLGDERMETINMQGIAEELIKKGYCKQNQGKWIYHECVSSHEGAISGYSCSECSAFVDEDIFDMDEFHKEFCGCCGANMKGGAE